MLAIERRQRIINIIQDKKKVLVQQLASEFSVTEETIRRDLEKLEDQGILKRTYGGAVISEGTNSDMPLFIREVTNKEGKMKIAEKVANEIKEGETLMLDSSSTAFYVAKCLKESGKSVTLITNSLRIASEMQDVNGINLILAGGNFRISAKSFVGKWAENIVKNYYVNKAILCCKGMDMNRGVMDSNEQEAEVKKNMAKCADEVFLIVDNVKFNRSSFVKIMDFKDIDYVYTDNELSEEWENTLKTNEVEIIIC